MTFPARTLSRALLFATAFAFGACDDGSDETEDAAACTDAEKCDTPGGSQQEQCLARQSEVLNSSQRGYTPTAIRWGAGDVEGVNTVSQDDRGQEYTEYFVIF